jgi:hypothetical protein
MQGCFNWHRASGRFRAKARHPSAFDTKRGDLPEEVARVLLKAKLAKADRRHMEELGELAQQGGLTPAQRREAEAYMQRGQGFKRRGC